ncbi:MAG: ABC transporter permease [Lachnospiraceae bacterium]|nr:ABC transporter permease [Lachnospiraceae bacterium]
MENQDIRERNEEYSIGDDRRVKSLSPGALVRRRFFRNKVAVIGLVILIAMFVFSFIGGIVSPYSQDQLFYRDEKVSKDYASAKKNDEYQFLAKDSEVFTSGVKADMIVAILDEQPQFTSGKDTFTLTKEGNNFYSAKVGDKVCGCAYKSILTDTEGKTTFDFDTTFAALKALTNGEKAFSAGGKDYTIDESGAVSLGDKVVGNISSFIIKPANNGVELSKEFRAALVKAVKDDSEKFEALNHKGKNTKFTLSFNADKEVYTAKTETVTRKYDTYSYPSAKHWLGTDVNGMDLLTRLMYGGRVSLLIGFIVEFIAAAIGVTMGGISGYFGGKVDNFIMRIVDVFYCIPTMPLIIILGSIMDKMHVSPMMRMVYLMLILGFLGWPSMARLVRGQVLLFREQEFMVATEATGLSVRRRIFKHLVPNVIPQLIVSMTMGLGGTIITEATLSFLGLGVKFPFASWGNIINDVGNTFVLTNYWFVWIPAGVLLLLTVVAFNLVGDGLRDAFDPRMKR